MTELLPEVAIVKGSHSPEGEAIREVFSRTVARGAKGSQFVVSLKGKTIVDLVSGDLNETTPVQVHSVTKLLVAIAAAHAHMTGVLDLDAPLASYWQAFARPATEDITARMVLDHSSGINAVSKTMNKAALLAGELDQEVCVQDPFWSPGVAHGYGAFTYGALMSGVFQQGIGITLQAYIDKHIVEPCGADFWLGAPADVIPKIADLTFSAPVFTEGQMALMTQSTGSVDGAMVPIFSDPGGFFSDPEVKAASWPAMSGVSTARALNQILKALLGYSGQAPLLCAASLSAMLAERSHGMDRTLGHVTRYGSGVELSHAYFPLLGEGSFGHQGAGGSVAVADPESGLVVTYTSTQVGNTVGASDAALILLDASKVLFKK